MFFQAHLWASEAKTEADLDSGIVALMSSIILTQVDSTREHLLVVKCIHSIRPI